MIWSLFFSSTFPSLEVVSRSRFTQLQVSENHSELSNRRPLFKILQLSDIFDIEKDIEHERSRAYWTWMVKYQPHLYYDLLLCNSDSRNNMLITLFICVKLF